MEAAPRGETQFFRRPFSPVSNSDASAIIASENPVRDDEPRNIVMHVNFADPERLNLVLNNVENILDHYRERENTVTIRVVCHGPGLRLLRNDTSPVRERILQMTDDPQHLAFYACSNTVARITKAEGQAPELIAAAILVPAGLPEIIELQRQGWIYLKP
jgi:intracellular sulfur oxidation DsrE/DsrF family protein